MCAPRPDKLSLAGPVSTYMWHRPTPSPRARQYKASCYARCELDVTVQSFIYIYIKGNKPHHEHETCDNSTSIPHSLLEIRLFLPVDNNNLIRYHIHRMVMFD